MARANGPSETTPLIDRHDSNLSDQGDHSFVRRLLWDSGTPGQDSDNVFVRYAANGFNIFKATMLCSPVNILIVFVPLGIIAGIADWGAPAVFTLNFFAIIPLAAMLSFATEEISEHVGASLGGLLNATFGNAVELIVSIVALREGQIEVVQSSMLGSILSNVLLVMGMCFVLGGIYNGKDKNGQGKEQEFALGTAQTSCSLMAVSSATLIIPAALYAVMNDAKKEDRDRSILILSRGTAIVMLFLYVTYLWFQLKTHANLFDPEKASRARHSFQANELPGVVNESVSPTNTTLDTSAATINGPSQPRAEASTVSASGESEATIVAPSAGAVVAEETKHMSPWSAGIVLILVTLVIAFCAEYLVDSIDAIVATGALSKNFIGLILIPIVGNAAEHVTACVVAVRDKMDLAMSVAIGSSIQIALLVTPALVILGWAVLDQPMTLRFETFETVVFGMSVLLVCFTVQDGNSNYLEGALLLGLYIIIALAFYATPPMPWAMQSAHYLSSSPEREVANKRRRTACLPIPWASVTRQTSVLLLKYCCKI